MSRVLLGLTALLLLAACAPKTEYVYQHRQIAVAIPQELFIYPKTEAPPGDAYASLTSWREKEQVLTSYIASLQGTIKGFTQVLKRIEEYNKGQQDVVKVTQSRRGDPVR